MTAIVSYEPHTNTLSWNYQTQNGRGDGFFSASYISDEIRELFHRKVLPSPFTMNRSETLIREMLIEGELKRVWMVLQAVEPGVDPLAQNLTELQRTHIQHVFRYLVEMPPLFIRERGLEKLLEGNSIPQIRERKAALAHRVEEEWRRKQAEHAALCEHVLQPLAVMIEDYASQFNDPDEQAPV